MAKKKKRVLVAMSGGIDSSVSAIKLHEAGYEVIGITMKTWNYQSGCSTKKQIGCCNLDTINDAREVAARIGFPYMVLDIRKTFGEHVVNHFVSEYVAGRTPNPCVLCNTHIKWDALRERADELGCDYLATGHYAQVKEEKGRYVLYRSNDASKDQTYALWGLSQANLKRTLFPLGHLKKSEVRAFAAEKGFSNLVSKSESYEICFIPDNDYRGFLKRRVAGLEEKVKGGDFVLSDGTVVGKHEGYPFYTVGQRKGLKIALGYAVYVTAIDPKTNRITVGKFDELARDGMYVHQLNMVKYKQIPNYTEAMIKIRYNGPSYRGIVLNEGERLKVFFGEGVHAIAPGQAAVLYTASGEVMAGGWIASSFRQQRIFKSKAV
ncbi:MAG: tRNA 2-thiouridine(34) synthase MnmA [Bacteroidota bacterium]